MALVRVKWFAQLLGQSVEAGLSQNLLDKVVKCVYTRAGNLIPGQAHRPLLIALTPKFDLITSRHSMPGFSVTWRCFSTPR